MTLGSVGSLGHPLPVAATAARSAASLAAPASGSDELQGAEASLLSGAGPAAGTVWSCQSGSGGGSASCAPAAPGLPAPSARPATTTLPDWTLQPGNPTGRQYAAMTWDALDKEIVLFGGYNTTVGTLSDTWIFNGAWTELSIAGPSARYGMALAYDYHDKYVVLYGGYSTTASFLSETWKFAKGAWTHLSPAKSPPALFAPTMTWDANDSYLVLFGGEDSAGNTLGETWTFVGGAWTQQAPKTSPSGRYLAQMAYDNANGWVLLYGGYNTTSGELADTWNYSHGEWTHRHPASSPGPLYAGSATNDSADGYLLLFGGYSTTWPAKTWTFQNDTWTRYAPSNNPPGTSGATAAFDKTLDKVVFVTGYTPAHGTANATTWVYRADVWTRYVANLPDARIDDTMTYDEADGYVLLFGGVAISGSSGSTFLNDSWSYAHGRWTHLKTPVAPPAREGAAMTYDETDGYVLLFGGFASNGSLLNDTWSFVGGKWTEIFPSVSPGARFAAGMVYDAYDGYVVLFGGWGSDAQSTYVTPSYGLLNDTWTYSAGTWINIIGNYCYGAVSYAPACVSDPPQRESTMMVYDAADGYVLLFGGYNGSRASDFSDTWEFYGGSWYNVTASVGKAPPACDSGAITYDAWDGYVLLYGGIGARGIMSETWNFTGGAWSAMSPASTPGPSEFSPMAYDPTDSAVVFLPATSFYTAPDWGTWQY